MTDVYLDLIISRRTALQFDLDSVQTKHLLVIMINMAYNEGPDLNPFSIRLFIRHVLLAE